MTWRGEPLALTRLERNLLTQLATAPVGVWTYERLFESVWGCAFLGDTSILHSAVKRLRRKLHAVDDALRVHTVRGIGYRLSVGLMTWRHKRNGSSPGLPVTSRSPLVGDTGFEPVTSSVSRKRATAAPIARACCRGGDGI